MSVDDTLLRVAWQRHVGGPTFAAVVARYREPHRRYHDVRHLVWVIRHLGDFDRSGLLTDAGATFAAGFYHDAIYSPTAVDNEMASARLAARDLAGWTPDRIERVRAMIEATTDHLDTGDGDTGALLAADLAVLAAEPTRYADYARRVRAEYHHVDDTAWRRGRGEVLRTLLARPRIFPELAGVEGWEARARANLTAELAQL